MENKSFLEIAQSRFDMIVNDADDIVDISEEIFEDYYSQFEDNENKN